MKAFDMDGVLCTDPEKWLIDGIGYKLPLYSFFKHIIQKKILKPDEEIIVVTARPLRDKWIAKLWFKVHGYKVKEIYMPKKLLTVEEAAKWKLKILLRLGVTQYYEDNVLITSYIRKNSNIEVELL